MSDLRGTIKKRDCYVSVDVETDGLQPGFNSMLSLGAVAFVDGKEASSFYAVLKPAKGAKQDPDTITWWMGFPDKWAELQLNQEEPAVAMSNFYTWVAGLPKPRALAANPAAFDASFIFHYLHRYVGRNAAKELFGMSRCLDIRSYLAALLGQEYSKANRDLIPAEWTAGLVINHNALDDARQQGVVLMRLMEE